jgi:hypothetical protein
MQSAISQATDAQQQNVAQIPRLEFAVKETGLKS